MYQSIIAGMSGFADGPIILFTSGLQNLVMLVIAGVLIYLGVKKDVEPLLLVPIVLVPLSVATLAIVFGQPIEHWMVANAGHELRHVVIFLWRMVRWLVALITSAAVMSALYHFGTRHKEHWTRVAPGAITGTLIWFPATLAFGLYVTRVANYSLLYGSFGTGIATLVWLYITSFSVMLGAELNGLQYGRRQRRRRAADAASRQEEPRTGLINGAL